MEFANFCFKHPSQQHRCNRRQAAYLTSRLREWFSAAPLQSGHLLLAVRLREWLSAATAVFCHPLC